MTQDEADASAEPIVGSMVPFSQLGLPYNLDAWDGFPAARERLYANFANNPKGRLLTLTGDSHMAWANSLTDKTGVARGVEFATTSITSKSIGNFFPNIPDFGAEFSKANESVEWNKATGHGYCRITLTNTEAKAEYVEVSNTETREFEVSVVQTATAQRDNLAQISMG